MAALALPASLAAQVMVAYQPHYLASLQEAASQLQSLSPHFAPMEDHGNTMSLTNDYALARVEVDKLGIKLYFSKSPAQQIQFLWSWNGASNAPPYAPYTGDIITSMVFANIGQFQMINFNQAGSNFPATWCIQPDNQPPGGNRMLCIATQEEAQALVDALATLVVASGGDLVPNDGIGGVYAIEGKYLKKHPGETGAGITSVAPGGPAALAGLQAGDIVHAVNGKPYVFGQGMIDNAEREVTWHKPQGGAVHLDIFRNHAPMAIDIRYAKLPVNPELLRQGKQMAEQNGAPPSGLHFGFQVRPVIQDDMAPLALTQAKGIVVVSVLNGGLADTMGILPGDVILSVNGAEAGDMAHFTQLIHGAAVSTFSVWRKGKAVELTVPQTM